MPDPRWQHIPSAWFRDIGTLAALGMIVIFATWVLLIRSRPDPNR